MSAGGRVATACDSAGQAKDRAHTASVALIALIALVGPITITSIGDAIDVESTVVDINGADDPDQQDTTADS